MKRAREILSAAVLALLVLAAGGVAVAEAQGFRRGIIASCAEDTFRLCPGVRPGGGRIIVCLNSQAERLSPACFQALAERGLAFAAALRLCRPDYERLCPGVPPGMGRALGCLLDNRAKVSAPCSEALSAHGFADDGEAEAPNPGRRGNGPPFPPAPPPSGSRAPRE